MIDELVREGARRMQAQALAAEVADYIARFAPTDDLCLLAARLA